MVVSLKGAPQSNGTPGTQYEYEQPKIYNRTPTSVHVELWVRVRINNPGSYFSFAIGHETVIRQHDIPEDAPDEVKKGTYYKRTFKNNRQFWYGNQGWHGFYCVFNADVPVTPDATEIDIIPVFTRPCICTGSGDYAPNWYEKCNWQGCKGQWIPFDSNGNWIGNNSSKNTKYVGYWANRYLPEDGCFLNNRRGEFLMTNDGFAIGDYPRIGKVQLVKPDPVSIDVSESWTQTVSVWWDKVNTASARYYVYAKLNGGEPKNLGLFFDRDVNQTTKARPFVAGTLNAMKEFNVASCFLENGEDFKDGDEVLFGVLAIDMYGKPWKDATDDFDNITWAAQPVKYKEVQSTLPTEFTLHEIGAHEQSLADNNVHYRGGQVQLKYKGQVSGSYPIKSYEIRCESGSVLKWDVSQEQKDAAGYSVVTAYFNPLKGMPFISGLPVKQLHCWLQATNNKGRVLMTAEAKPQIQKLPFSLCLYGGKMSVYGRYYSDTREKTWINGSAWISLPYGEGEGERFLTWKRAYVVYVYDGTEWVPCWREEAY